MGKVFLHGIAFDHTNRGCQALSYGSIDFIFQKLNIGVTEIIMPTYYIRRKKQNIVIPHSDVKVVVKYFWLFDIWISIITYKLFCWTNIRPIFPFAKELFEAKYICNINGGDSFSDIYGFNQFFSLAIPSLVSVFLKKKLILLPQTIGPFQKRINRRIADYILKGSFKIYIRDDMFIPELKKMNLEYFKEPDVSIYLQPQKIENIEIDKGSVGLNISGLAYYNSYNDLTGKFEHYKELIVSIIESFQTRNIKIYLLPHTYNFRCPEKGSDDLSASKEIVHNLKNKNNVEVVNYDLNAAQLKYLISRFDFFIGTRMHACFSAIFTKTPIFGLAYSYKFSGSFDNFGLNSCYESVINIKFNQIPKIVEKITDVYNEREQYRLKLEREEFEI